jgi:hypothetical protein
MSHPLIFSNNPLKYRGFFIQITLDNYPKTMYSITINEQRKVILWVKLNNGLGMKPKKH